MWFHRISLMCISSQWHHTGSLWFVASGEFRCCSRHVSILLKIITFGDWMIVLVGYLQMEGVGDVGSNWADHVTHTFTTCGRSSFTLKWNHHVVLLKRGLCHSWSNSSLVIVWVSFKANMQLLYHFKLFIIDFLLDWRSGRTLEDVSLNSATQEEHFSLFCTKWFINTWQNNQWE